VPDEALEWHHEYLYRRAFPGLTHEQYLDEPGDAIQWLLRIDKLHRDAEAERERAARG
jgi:hypothetical protein